MVLNNGMGICVLTPKDSLASKSLVSLCVSVSVSMYVCVCVYMYEHGGVCAWVLVCVGVRGTVTYAVCVSGMWFSLSPAQ